MFANPIEKRRHIRFDSRIPMRYRKIETNAREFKGSLMRNISEGGVKATIHEFLPLNSKLAMEIPLVSGRKSVNGTCRVAWIKKAGFSEQYNVGTEFLHLSEADKIEIANFIFSKSVEKVL